MKKDVLRAIDGAEIFPVIALVIFFVLFTVVLIGLFTMKKSKLEKLKNLPLDEDDKDSNIIKEGLKL